MFLPLDLWTNDPPPIEVRPPLVCGVRGVRWGEEAEVVPRVVGRGVPVLVDENEHHVNAKNAK